MSNMLEQAIIDAAALREAALKNAEQSIIEKYAPRIKEAVETMLENDPVSEAKRKMRYEGRIIEIVHEADERGKVTVSDGNKPFVVNESELSEVTNDELLQEEEMNAAMDTSTPPQEIEAPPAWDSRYGDTESVVLSALLDKVDSDQNLTIDLDAIELSLMQQQQAEMPAEEPFGEPEGIEALGGDEEIGDLLGDLGGEEEELQLQEVLDAIQKVLEEKMEVDMGEAKQGWITTNKTTLEHEADMQEAHDEHLDEEEVLEEEEDEDLKEALSKIDQFQQTFETLKQQNKKLENIVYKLNSKLQETLLANAKLLYQNRTLNDASLNERQKLKIVEAIGNAESPKEARNLHETLRSAVGTSKKKAPQSLSESVNHKSSLSSMLYRRQNINESQSPDPFFDRMKRLAGIK